MAKKELLLSAQELSATTALPSIASYLEEVLT
jgi:hypothetical protein